MISLAARPKLAKKAMLRHDRKTGRYLLLYPEKGLLLNDTGTKVVKLCTGELSVEAIVGRLYEEHAGTSRETVESEVLAFLDSLAERGLLELDS